MHAILLEEKLKSLSKDMIRELTCMYTECRTQRKTKVVS